MKATKFVVLGSAGLAALGVFMNWVSVADSVPKVLSEGFPRGGMDHGGALFLFLLGMPLLAAAIGSAKRFGRGLALLGFLGAFCSVFMGLVKYADIQSAAHELGKLGAASGSIDAAPGYWVTFVGSSIAALACLVALIKPEPKLALTPAPQAPMAYPGARA